MDGIVETGHRSIYKKASFILLTTWIRVAYIQGKWQFKGSISRKYSIAMFQAFYFLWAVDHQINLTTLVVEVSTLIYIK